MLIKMCDKEGDSEILPLLLIIVNIISGPFPDFNAGHVIKKEGNISPLDWSVLCLWLEKEICCLQTKKTQIAFLYNPQFLRLQLGVTG